MSVRATSIAAYREANKAKAQSAVLSMMQSRADWTRQELADALRWSINRVCPRVLELIEMGAVEEPGTCRKNAGSNRSANVVRVKQ